MDTFAVQHLVWGLTLLITRNKSGLQVLCQTGAQSKFSNYFNRLTPVLGIDLLKGVTQCPTN